MRLIPLLFAIVLAGCATVRVEPIHITVDVNIKVDRALDDFFSGVPAVPAPSSAPTPAPSASSTPATPPPAAK